MMQQTAGKPNSMQAGIGPAFLVLLVVLVLAHLTGNLDAIYSHFKVDTFRDVWMFGLIAVLSLFAIQFGATAYSILPTATFASFAVLSIHQPEPLVRYLILAAVLFSIGMYGMIVSRNAVRVLMSIELMLNAANINLVAFSRYVDSHATGQVFAIFVLTVAAAEAAVGLAIVLAIYRNVATVDMERFNMLKW